MSSDYQRASVPVLVGDFGLYEIPEPVWSLNMDGRTKEGKLFKRYVKAVNELELVAVTLGLDVRDILPK